jgi:hypothetical protein
MKSGTFSPGSSSRDALIKHGYKQHQDAGMGKTLVLVGLGIAALGLLVMLGLPLGRLPGDFYVRRGNVSFYFPLATSIILSILLTLALAFFRR